MSETFSGREFRNALSAFATGVTIVTTCGDDGQPVGMTASSFNSVSVDPPLILWSVEKTALSAELFRNASHFAVHVLASDQVELSNRFARSGIDKFAECDFITDGNDVPIIRGAAARFDCSNWQTYEGGDHWIIVGLVNAFDHANAETLVFSSGSYAMASPLRAAREPAASPPGHASAIDGLLVYNLSRAYHQIIERLHNAVRETGLSISEWRILSTLHGKLTLQVDDLAARTFVDPHALVDIVMGLEESGLCTVSGSGEQMKVTGTTEGRWRVDHLMQLCVDLERQAIGTDDQKQRDNVIATLRNIIANTDG